MQEIDFGKTSVRLLKEWDYAHLNRYFGVMDCNNERIILVSAITTTTERIIVFNFRTGRVENEFEGHDRVHCARFSPDGSYIVSSGRDNYVKLWDLKRKKLTKIIKNKLVVKKMKRNKAMYELEAIGICKINESNDTIYWSLCNGLIRRYNLYNDKTEDFCELGWLPYDFDIKDDLRFYGIKNCDYIDVLEMYGEKEANSWSRRKLDRWPVSGWPSSETILIGTDWGYYCQCEFHENEIQVFGFNSDMVYSACKDGLVYVSDINDDFVYNYLVHADFGQ